MKYLNHGKREAVYCLPRSEVTDLCILVDCQTIKLRRVRMSVTKDPLFLSDNKSEEIEL